MQSDVHKMISDLRADADVLDRTIASLEAYQQGSDLVPPVPKPAKRRGRKSMNASERLEVSERMRKHWASRQTSPGGDLTRDDIIPIPQLN